MLAAIALVGAAATAGAQQYPLKQPEGTSTKPQQGTSPPPRAQEPDPRYPANPLHSPVPIGFMYLPAILMSDGTVWANFGSGYVQVRRACTPPRSIDSRGKSTPTRRERVETPCYTRNAQGSLVVTR